MSLMYFYIASQQPLSDSRVQRGRTIKSVLDYILVVCDGKTIWGDSPERRAIKKYIRSGITGPGRRKINMSNTGSVDQQARHPKTKWHKGQVNEFVLSFYGEYNEN